VSWKTASAAALAAIALAGCGESKKPASPVRLSVDAPADMALLHAESVAVHGVVAPADARVTIEGRDVAVSGGRFSAQVPLLPGTNLVDIVAGANGGARPAMVALRVRRQVSVAVPDLTGYTPADAKDALAGLGLHPDVQEAGGLLELLLPADARVCKTEPQPGSAVDPGAKVTVFAAKRC
jgi:hypothetical protein